MVAVLAGGLSACSGSAEGDVSVKGTESPSSALASESPAASDWDTTFKTVTPRISRDAIKKYGPKGAAEGTDAAVQVTLDYAFDQELMAAPAGQDEDAALAMTRDMTASGAQDWRTAVKTYNSGAKGREEKGGLVMSLTLYSAWSFEQLEGKETLGVQTEGPAAVNPRIKSVNTTLLPDGRLSVHVLSSANVRLVKRHKPVQMKIDRDQTFWMMTTPTGWKVDGWTGSLKAGQYKPERQSS